MLKLSKFLTIIFCCSVLFGGFAESVKAQVGKRVPIETFSPKQPATGRRNPPRIQTRIEKVVVAKEVIKRETKLIKTSNLVVSSESGAKVLLKSLVKGVKPVSKDVPMNDPENKTVEFENLKTGKYVVTASLDGYKAKVADVTIEPQETTGISLDLEPFYYQMIIDTNIDEGEVRFARAKLDKINPDGSLVTSEPGDYCIVKIKDKKAVINKLQKGYYNIDISSTAIEYEPILTAVSIPRKSNEKDAEFIESQLYGINLEVKFSTETFNSAWVNEEWVLPAGWKLQDGQMKTKGLAGIALPRAERYKYYINFEMISDVKLSDGKTIGFALRAVNPQNYYLIQISGAKATNPFIISGFAVKNGKLEQITSLPINNVASIIKKSKGFRVVIRGEDNIFKVFVVDSEDGDEKPLGNIIDQYKNFPKGAVGIVGLDGSSSEIGLFNVQPIVVKN